MNGFVASQALKAGTNSGRKRRRKSAAACRSPVAADSSQNEKFVASFESAGFRLREYFFDYVCGGTTYKPEYLEYEYRRSKQLPGHAESPKQWVVGNYYFY